MNVRVLSLAALSLSLAGCSQDDAPAADPAPSHAATQATAPLASQDTTGMEWSFRKEGPGALFGPADAEAIFSLDCTQITPDQSGMALAWVAPAEEDATQSLAISDEIGGDVEILMSATASVEGPEYYWEGLVQAESPGAEMLSRTDTPFVLALDGRRLRLPAGDAMARVIAACR